MELNVQRAEIEIQVLVHYYYGKELGLSTVARIIQRNVICNVNMCGNGEFSGTMPGMGITGQFSIV